MRLPPLLNAPQRRGNDMRHRRFRPTLIRLEGRTVLSPTVFTVTGVGDSPSDPQTTTSGDLRYCVGLADANTSNPDGSLIQFDPSVFSVPQTITLGSGLVLSNTADQTTITGPAAALTVSGGGPSSDFRVFVVNSGVTASMSGLTITDGNTIGWGGGMFNDGTATLTNSTISGNSASVGGGLYNAGTATLTNVALSDNSSNSGGGIENTGMAILTNCTIAGNLAGSHGSGGGIDDNGTATLTNCTISDNEAPAGIGGGISIDYFSTATLTNCTISGNSAPDGGGGIFNQGTTTLTGVTISGNSATSFWRRRNRKPR